MEREIRCRFTDMTCGRIMGRPKGRTGNKTKAQFEQHLNQTLTEADVEYINKKRKFNQRTKQAIEGGLYGMVLRKYDPVGFQTAYDEWKYEPLVITETVKVLNRVPGPKCWRCGSDKCIC